MQNKLEQDNVTYINSDSKTALSSFSHAFYGHFTELYDENRQVIMLCIGTDRVTGDSLGPIIGYKLNRYSAGIFKEIKVYGTLESPVHAKNLKETIDEIYSTYENPLVIAIDASLGNMNYVGYLTLGEGTIKPGSGVNKDLPEVGDIFITGIVNINGIMGSVSIQHTRLGLIMKMADIIYYGLVNSMGKVSYSKRQAEKLKESEPETSVVDSLN